MYGFISWLVIVEVRFSEFEDRLGENIKLKRKEEKNFEIKNLVIEL